MDSCGSCSCQCSFGNGYPALGIYYSCCYMGFNYYYFYVHGDHRLHSCFPQLLVSFFIDFSFPFLSRDVDIFSFLNSEFAYMTFEILNIFFIMFATLVFIEVAVFRYLFLKQNQLPSELDGLPT